MNESVKDTNIELKDEERTKCEIWTRVMGYHRPISSFIMSLIACKSLCSNI